MLKSNKEKKTEERCQTKQQNINHYMKNNTPLISNITFMEAELENNFNKIFN